ncbi:MAG: dTDP-4-dehydrorhamnose reductase [Clostridiales bacterium]|nr:dTDP-4-dehydrorhamnose reductase [Clostridiales bacterium]
MRIAIIGCKGQLGSALIKLLREGNCRLGTLPEVYTNAELSCADLPELDITDAAQVSAFAQAARPHLLINCAAYTAVDVAESNENTAYAINATAVENLARAAQTVGAKFVHISTDYVFDGRGDRPYTEADTPNPQTAYGRGKIAGEGLVFSACDKAFVLRTAWLYGETGSNFVKTMLKKGRELGALRVVSDQHGCPTNAADLAFFLLLLAATENYGLYHCTGAGETTWYDFAREILRLGKVAATLTPCTTAEYRTAAARPAYSALDCGKLEKTLDRRMPCWKEALAAFLQMNQ